MMKVYGFERVIAASVIGAIEALSAHPEARILAGGQSLIPLMALRLSTPEILIDINAVAELSYIQVTDDGSLRIGAMTRQNDLLRAPSVLAKHPVVAEIVPLIAHNAIRNRGTVGGSLAHADPAAEWPSLAVAVGADIEVAGPSGHRVVAAESFYQGPFTTALQPTEMVTGISIPPFHAQHGWAVVEMSRRQGDFAMAGAIVLVSFQGRCIADCRIGLIGVTSQPVRAHALECALIGTTEGDALGGIVDDTLLGSVECVADIHVSAEFRAHLAKVVTRRALAQAISRARRDGQ